MSDDVPKLYEGWNRTENGLPKSGQRVDWIAPSGEQVDGGLFDRVWFLPGPNPIYVYYTPWFWRPASVV